MKPKFLLVTRALFGLLLLGAAAWAVYLALTTAVRGLVSLRSELAVAVITASVTVAVSVISILLSKHLEHRAVIIQELRARKTPIYEDIISTMFKVVFADKLGEQPLTEAELMRFFAATTEKLTVWGSDGVITAFRAFRLGPPAPPAEMLFLYERFLLEVRRDLGHKNKDLKKGTLLGLFVNDLDRYL